MLTVKQEDKLVDRIKGLSEIEMSHLIENMVDHMRKNNMMHLLDSYLEDPDTEEIEEKCCRLQEKVENLESDIDKCKRKLSEINEMSSI